MSAVAPAPRFVRAQYLLAYLDLDTREHLDALVDSGVIPQPVRLSRKSLRWDLEAVEDALRARSQLAEVTT